MSTWKPLQMPSTGRPEETWVGGPASRMISFITGANRAIAPQRR